MNENIYYHFDSIYETDASEHILTSKQIRRNALTFECATHLSSNPETRSSCRDWEEVRSEERA